MCAFLWLQDCVLLWTIRLMINDAGDAVLHLKCPTGSGDPSRAEETLEASDQGARLELPAMLSRSFLERVVMTSKNSKQMQKATKCVLS